ncbi:4230_t:CDS:2 [Cetraspora pellucida]|uniref:4230_t:CDS:1 n=1 Tax=Cetraspora pellucida TaxID=1433469 RepID=A0A9N8ZS05_9GLOM|nr:4230_t:CDS:2 [Cetraspora pellucida]
MKYVNSYILNYYSINDYQQFFEELFETERQYDTLSVIQPNETPQQWALRGKFVDHDYYRSRIYKTRMAICLNCMKLIQVNDVKLKKKFHHTIEMVWQELFKMFGDDFKKESHQMHDSLGTA